MLACLCLRTTIHYTESSCRGAPVHSHLTCPPPAAAAAAAAAAALKLLLVLMVWCIGVVLPVNYTVRPDATCELPARVDTLEPAANPTATATTATYVRRHLQECTQLAAVWSRVVVDRRRTCAADGPWRMQLAAVLARCTDSCHCV
jgi:hypothetical protein